MAMRYVGAAWAKIGRRDKAGKILRELERFSTQRYVGPIVSALVYLGLDDIDAGVDGQEKAFDARDGMVPFIGVDAALDGRRSDPGFGAMLKRLGLHS